MDHAGDPVQAAVGDRAHVGDHELDAVANAVERLLAPVEAVEHADLVAARQQARHQNRADVAGATRDEDGLVRLGCVGGETVAALVATGQRNSLAAGIPIGHATSLPAGRPAPVGSPGGRH